MDLSLYSNGCNRDVKTTTMLNVNIITGLKDLGVTPDSPGFLLCFSLVLSFLISDLLRLFAGLHTPVWPLKTHYRKRSRIKERKIDEKP